MLSITSRGRPQLSRILSHICLISMPMSERVKLDVHFLIVDSQKAGSHFKAGNCPWIDAFLLRCPSGTLLG